MKTITALEFLTTKAKKQLLDNFNEFIDIIKMSNDWATDNMFWIDEWDTTLHINIDEKFFQIDGQDLVSWCEVNTRFANLSDKNITILNFVL